MAFMVCRSFFIRVISSLMKESGVDFSSLFLYSLILMKENAVLQSFHVGCFFIECCCCPLLFLLEGCLWAAILEKCVS